MIDRRTRQAEFAREIFQEWMSIGHKDKRYEVICFIHGERIVINMAWHKGLLGSAKRLQFFEEIIGDGSWL